MGVVSIFFSYFKWHYSRSLKDAVLIWRNFLLFFFHFFSLGVLTRTFFKPWRRLGEQYSGRIDITKPFETLFKPYIAAFVINSMTRIAGMIIRGFILLIGFFVEIIAGFLGIVLIIAWFFAPFIAAILFVMGIALLNVPKG